MDDKPPILDYQSPGAIQAKQPLPLILRMLLGVVAAIVTFLAATGLTAGLLDALDGYMGHFLIGPVCLIIAYFLWKPVGLHFLPRLRKHESPEPRSEKPVFLRRLLGILASLVALLAWIMFVRGLVIFIEFDPMGAIQDIVFAFYLGIAAYYSWQAAGSRIPPRKDDGR